MSTLSGTVFEDLNSNGVQDTGEGPLAGMTVYLDLNDNSQLDLVGTGGVEPDDFSSGTVLTNVANGVTLSTLDGNGNVIASAPVFAAGGATSPNKLFGHQSGFGAEDVLWDEGFRSLRIDFASPMDSVAVDYISRGQGDRGRLQVFDPDGNLLQTTFTPDNLANGERFRMGNGAGNIAYAIATSVGNSNGYLDSLSYLGGTPEPNQITDANGSYAFNNLAAGSYIIRQVVPDGYEQTSPNVPRLFAIDHGNDLIVELSPVDGTVLNSFAAPGGAVSNISGLAYDGNTIYYVEANGDTLYELDPDTGNVRDSLNLDPLASARWDGIAAIDGLVYLNAAGTSPQRILVIDPATDALVRTITFAPSNIVPFGGLGEVQYQGRTVLTGIVGSSSSIVYLDPNDTDVQFGDQLAIISHPSSSTDRGLTGFNNELFVGFDDAAGTVYVLEPDGTQIRSFQTGFGMSGLGGAGDGAHRVTLADGQTLVGLDFGNGPDGERLQGTIFHDANGNGVQDTGESGLAQTFVYLDQNNNAHLDPGEKFLLTGDDGKYEFVGLTPGEYIVRQIPPKHYQQTSPVFTDSYYAYLYVVGSGGQMQIGRIDPETGDVQRLGTPQGVTTQRMHGLIRTNDGKFFGINGFNSTPGTAPNDSLYTIDLLTNEVTLIGEITVNGSPTNAAYGLAYDPQTDAIYGLVRDPFSGTLKLAMIDRTSGAATVRGIGTNGLTGTSGLAYDTARNAVVAYDNADDQFWEFHLNGSVTLLWDTSGLDGWGFAYNGSEYVLHARQVDNGDPDLYNRLMWRIDPYQQTIASEFFVASEAIPMESLEYYRVEGGRLVFVEGSQTLTGLDFGNRFVNQDPTANDDVLITNEDTAFSLNVRANDTDPDADPLTVTSVTQGSNGSVSINPDGMVKYTPNPNFNGGDSFTYQISDGFGGTNVGTVNVTVNPVNDAPVAVNDAYSTDEDTPLTVNTPGVLSNDSDIDGDQFTAVLMSGPSNGTLSLNANGSFTYTPNANFNGSDSFTYKANDGSLNSNVATVSLTVNAVNDAPMAANDSYTTDEDTPLNLAATGVLANDEDFDSGSLSAVLVSGPSSGTLTLNTDGSFTYTPNANFNGNDSFNYKANDGSLDSNIATVRLTVNAVNDAPVAADDSAATDENVPVVIDVLNNDVDVDGDPLSVSSVSDPANGTVTINTDQSLTYTPNTGFDGVDTFTYVISDGNGGISTATVTVTVRDVLDVPTVDFQEGILTIGGTSGDDHIKLRQRGQDLIVRVDSPSGVIDQTFTGVNLILIDAKAGNDKVQLNPSVTITAGIWGGDGDDQLSGGSGHNYISGGAGNDQLQGGGMGDVLDGGDGDDHLQGDDGDDILLGGLGTDRLQGGKGQNQIFEDPVDPDTLASLFANLEWLDFLA